MPGSRSARTLLFVALLGAVAGAVFFLLRTEDPDDLDIGDVATTVAEVAEVEAPEVGARAAAVTQDDVRRDVVEADPVEATPAGPPPSYAEALGGITGRIVELDQTPVPDLSLELVGAALDEIFVSSDALFGDPATWELGLVKGSTRTDDEGRFRFTGVDPRAMHVLAVDSGGARADLRILDATPNAGEEHDVGDVVLRPFVTFTGKVVDYDGQPVAGARVRATDIPAIVFQFGAADVHEEGGFVYEAPSRSGKEWGVFKFPRIVKKVLERVPVPATETAEDGTFVLAGVPIGVVTVLVDEPGFVTLVHGPVPTGMAGGERAIGMLTIDEGDELAGAVVDGAGDPIAGAEVMIGPKTEIGEAALLRPGGSADGGGRFHVVGVSDEDHFVAARKPGGVDWIVLADVSPGATDLELRFAEEHDLRVLAVNQAGETVARPQLVLNEIGEEEAMMAAVIVGPRPLAARTAYDEEGAAVVSGLGTGRYRVLVRADGYAAKDVEADLREGTSDLRVELEPERLLRVRAVRGADGAPVEFARVMAFEADDDFDIEALPFASARTDADGRARLRGIPEAGCNLRVSHPAYAIADLTELTADVEVDVPLLSGGTVKGRVHAGGQPITSPRFVGVGADDGVAMPRFRTSDPEGGFEFTRLAPGQYNVVVMPRFAHEKGVVDVFQDMMTFAMPEREVEVAVVEGQETWVDIDVLGVDGDFRTATLSGRVLMNSRPAAQASVSAMPQGAWEGRKSTRADADGRFDFGQVAIGPSGKVNLMVAPAGVQADNWWMGGFYNQTLHLPENSSRMIVIDIRTGRLAGRIVRDDDGQPVGGAQVIVRSSHQSAGSVFQFGGGDETTEPPPQSEEPPPASAQVVQSAADGRFEVPMLPAGTYVVRVDHEGFSDARSEPVAVSPGGAPAPVTVRLFRAVIVKGRIVLPEGAPTDGNRWLQFARAEEGASENLWTNVEDDGSFETDELGPAEWRATLNTWSNQGEHHEYQTTFTVPKSGLPSAVLHLSESTESR